MTFPTDAEECALVSARDSSFRRRWVGVPLGVWAVAAVTAAVAAWAYGYIPWHP